MGTVYLIPHVDYDDTISRFDSSTPTVSQLAVFNAIKNAGINGYTTKYSSGYYTKNFYAVTSDNIYIAWYAIENVAGYNDRFRRVGFYIRNDNAISIGIIYDRHEPNKLYAYDPKNFESGVHNSTSYEGNGWIEFNVDYFASEQEAYDAINEAIAQYYPITYRPNNCSFLGAPTEAIVGDTVVVPVSFPDGYGLVNESNIYVTSNGVVIPSTYSNGQLTFTMPDPS